MKTILVFVPCYLPGYKFGGPVRSVANMVKLMSEHFSFRIFTLDRDVGDDEPYEDVTSDRWNTRAHGEVFYCSPGRLGFSTIARIVNRTDHDVLYLNGMMNPEFTIYPLLLRRLGVVDPARVVLASRGVLSERALGLKRWKKQAYLAFGKAIGLFDDLVWHATSDDEEEDIRRKISPETPIFQARNVPVFARSPEFRGREKEPGLLDVVFLSRIDPMKNLDHAIRAFEGLAGDVNFDIYGPVADPTYWERCRRLADQLDADVRVSYRGPVDPGNVIDVLSGYHLFLLPTRNENFGHVVFEAMQAGCPLLISDRTLISGLEASGAGWTVPLDGPSSFREKLSRMLALDHADFGRMRERVQEFARAHYDLERRKEEYAILFGDGPGS